jgi:hypothetical protein
MRLGERVFGGQAPCGKVLGAPKVFASCIFSKLVVKKTFKSRVYKS